MTALARTTGESGALFDLFGTVATNATWSEDIYFTEAGAPYDISGMDWKLTLRCWPGNTSADITLSIGAGLSIEEDDDGNERILRINVVAGTFNSYEGDYIADLASNDSDDKVTLWGHGIISLRLNPVSFS